MAIRPKCTRHRVVSALVIAVLVAGPGSTLAGFAQQGPAGQAAEEAASGRGSVSGDLFHADGKTALEGGRAYAINVRSGQQYISEVVGKGGHYAIKGLPAGTYDIAVEIDGQVYVADNLVDISQGESVSLSYAVQPMRPANRVLKGLPQPKGSAEVMGVFRANATAAPSFWKSPGGITLLAILGAGAILALAASDDDDASPSTP